MARRSRARRGEGDRLRADILQAATGLLSERGDEEAVSIRAIADAVGVTPPSIYLHFADKDELIFAVCQEQFEALDAAVERAAAQGTDPLDALRRRAGAYVHFGLEHPEQYRVLFMSKAADTPDGFGRDQLVASAAFGHVVENVEACIAEGLMRDLDPYLVALSVWSAVHGITSLMISKPTFRWPPVQDLIDMVTDMLAFGFVEHSRHHAPRPVAGRETATIADG